MDQKVLDMEPVRLSKLETDAYSNFNKITSRVTQEADINGNTNCKESEVSSCIRAIAKHLKAFRKTFKTRIEASLSALEKGKQYELGTIISSIHDTEIDPSDSDKAEVRENVIRILSMNISQVVELEDELIQGLSLDKAEYLEGYAKLDEVLYHVTRIRAWMEGVKEAVIQSKSSPPIARG